MAHVVFNIVEGVFWLAMSALIARRYGKSAIGATIAFACFGISDFIEVRTGAWWRPWWLLAMKAGCLVVIGWFVWSRLRPMKIRRRVRQNAR